MEDPILPYQLFAGPITSRGCALQECKPYSVSATVFLKVKVVMLCQTPLEHSSCVVVAYFAISYSAS